jgi:hypothetical protein
MQRYPAEGRHDSSPLAREIGAMVAPGSGAASVATRKVAAGLALACPTQPIATSTRTTTPVVVHGRHALAMEIPAPAKVGAAVVTLHHHEERRGVAVHHQQELKGPAQGAQTPSGVAPAAARKEASKRAPGKPLVIGPGPTTAAGRRARAGSFMGVTPEPTS